MWQGVNAVKALHGRKKSELVSYVCILGSYKSEMSIQAMQILNEKEDLKKNLEESERKKSAKDDEIAELSDSIDDIRRSNDSLSSLKMKLQTDLELLQVRYRHTKTIIINCLWSG